MRLADTKSDVDLLNSVLAVEHAVVYGIASVGAQMKVAPRDRALAHHDAHRSRRDALTERVFALGGTPVASLPAYADVAAASPDAALVQLERAAVRAYLDVIGAMRDPAARKLCVSAFVAEGEHLAVARAAAGEVQPEGGPAFVTGD